jgi:hypothetical protein
MFKAQTVHALTEVKQHIPVPMMFALELQKTIKPCYRIHKRPHSASTQLAWTSWNPLRQPS